MTKTTMTGARMLVVAAGLAGLLGGCAEPAPEETTASSEAELGGGLIPLIRGATSRGHWALTNALPYAVVEEARWGIGREGDNPIWACKVGKHHNIVTRDPWCEGQAPMGFLGYLDAQPSPGMVGLHRCRVNAGEDHFISPDPGCEGHVTEGLLGYAVPLASPPPPPPLQNPWAVDGSGA